MVSKDETEHFLNDLKEKIEVFDLVIIERDKNQKTLAELGLVPSDCRIHIHDLTCENYFRGPTDDDETGGVFWEFGTMIKNREIYIKINYGLPNKSVICYSFHFSEFTITYPFKKKI